jgi:glycosyltransferase involved in cell wall biosynthesis
LGCPIFVVDSGSTDETKSIAISLGATVLHHPFENHSSQWAWALSAIPHCDWILGLDADQRLTSELQIEIKALFCNPSDKLTGISGFHIKRRQIFRGRWIKHGGYYPKHLLKLFRRSAVTIDASDLVDHHFYVAGPTQCLAGDLIEDNANEGDISIWIEKHNRYAILFAREEIDRKRNAAPRPIRARFLGNPDERTLWLKNRWFNLPRYVRPAIYFLYRYFLRFGFLDGEQGFIFHFLQAFWFRLLIDIKISESLAETRQNREWPGAPIFAPERRTEHDNPRA